MSGAAVKAALLEDEHVRQMQGWPHAEKRAPAGLSCTLEIHKSILQC